MKSVVNRVAVQLAKALQNKGMALLVNHGVSEEKVKLRKSLSLPKKLIVTINFLSPPVAAENRILTFGRLL